ncbi:helix-turn-helix transcriptional regulator [Maridesulfovibrio sp.]|uniref:helix-turn-helix transcriptional regulator n=1 Tax=Maridesulfovibrio sp. TaxID=2795000 RepID=UPI0039EE5E01
MTTVKENMIQAHTTQTTTSLATVNDDCFLRLNEVLKILSVSRSTWWANVKKGTYPQPYKISERTTAWKIADIRKLAGEIGRDEQNPS